MGADGGSGTRRKRADAVLQAQARSARRWSWAVGSTVTVVTAVIAMLVAYSLTHPSTRPTADHEQGRPVDPSVMRAVSSVPAGAFAAVGTGGTEKTAPQPISGPPLRANGRPRILYVGGEYCPVCAAERWAVIASLSRFGTFQNVSTMTSSPTDSFPDTPTFSFRGSSYASPYVSFDPYEVYDRNQRRLEQLPSADQRLLTRLHSGGIPFVDIAGKYLVNWGQFSPEVFAGRTRRQIAHDLSNPDSAVAEQVLGAANLFTAAVCAADGSQPASVCDAPGVVAATKALPAKSQ